MLNPFEIFREKAECPLYNESIQSLAPPQKVRFLSTRSWILGLFLTPFIHINPFLLTLANPGMEIPRKPIMSLS